MSSVEIVDLIRFLGVNRVDIALQKVKNEIKNGIVKKSDADFIFDVIKNSGHKSIKKNILTRMTQKLNQQDRNKAIQQLIDSKRINFLLGKDGSSIYSII